VTKHTERLSVSMSRKKKQSGQIFVSKPTGPTYVLKSRQGNETKGIRMQITRQFAQPNISPYSPTVINDVISTDETIFRQ
jgi:hypothetical protein